MMPPVLLSKEEVRRGMYLRAAFRRPIGGGKGDGFFVEL
jgi:hypothetical protein